MSTFSQDNLVSITMQRKIQLIWLHNYKRRLVSTRNKFTRLISVPLNVCTRCFSFHNSHIFNSTAIMHAQRAFSRITCRSLFIQHITLHGHINSFDQPGVRSSLYSAYISDRKIYSPFGRLYKSEFTNTVAQDSIRILCALPNVFKVKWWAAVFAVQLYISP